MSATNQNQETEDSLKVIENDNGTLTIDWDPCDSRYSVLNTMTEDQLSAMITEELKKLIEKLNNGS
jgi:hypothetical protein